jgi:hypothetical protein
VRWRSGTGRWDWAPGAIQWVAKEQDTQESAQYISELEGYIGKFMTAPVETAKPEPIPEPAAKS